MYYVIVDLFWICCGIVVVVCVGFLNCSMDVLWMCCELIMFVCGLIVEVVWNVCGFVLELSSWGR